MQKSENERCFVSVIIAVNIRRYWVNWKRGPDGEAPGRMQNPVAQQSGSLGLDSEVKGLKPLLWWIRVMDRRLWTMQAITGGPQHAWTQQQASWCVWRGGNRAQGLTWSPLASGSKKLGTHTLGWDSRQELHSVFEGNNGKAGVWGSGRFTMEMSSELAHRISTWLAPNAFSPRS